jgi:4-amino-4-deoxy-L-arabinose transferase-like glycosyltransferase
VNDRPDIYTYLRQARRFGIHIWSKSRYVRIVAAAISIGAAFAARHVDDSKRVPIYVVAATAVAILGASVSFPAFVPRTLEPYRLPEARPRVILAAFLFLVPTIVAILIWSTEPFSRSDEFVQSSSTVAAFLWLFGIVVGLFVLWDRDRDRPCRTPSKPTRFWTPRLGWANIVLLFILLVGTGLRLWHISSLPEGIWSDEADSAADAVRLLHAPFQAFAPGNYGHNPSLYFYALAAAIRIGGDNIETVRVTSALFGVAGIAVAFGVGYQIFGVPAALYSASLMAMAQWAITFSRIALPNIPIPAITGLGYMFFIIAMHRPRPFWFALSGTMLGLSFLTYPGAYIPAGVPVLLLYGRSRSDPVFAAASRSGRLFLLLGLLASAAPMLTTLFLDGNYVLGRVHVTSLFNEYHDTKHQLLGLLDNVRSYMLMFTVQGDRNGRHNLSGMPMLDEISGVLFLLGLGICFRQWRLWQCRILLFWLGASLLSGILSLESEAPHGPRTLGGLVPALVIAALPLVFIEPLIRSIVNPQTLKWRLKNQQLARTDDCNTETRRRSYAGIGSALAASTILICALALNVNQYFREQARSLESWAAMGGQITVVARTIAQLNRPGNHVYTDESLANDIVMQFIAPSWKPQTYDPSRLLSNLPTSGSITFVVPVQEAGVMRTLRADIDNLKVSMLTPSFNSRMVEGYVVTWQAPFSKAKVPGS